MVVSSRMRQGAALVDLECICSKTPLMVCIRHPQGCSSWKNAELPITIGPNAPELVRDGRQRVGGPLIVFPH